MKSPEIGWMACAGAVLTTAVITVGQDTHPQRTVPAREVPVPSTVSPELQRVIAQRDPPPVKMPTTVEGWKEMQREADARAQLHLDPARGRRSFGEADRVAPEAARLFEVGDLQRHPDELVHRRRL